MKLNIKNKRNLLQLFIFAVFFAPSIFLSYAQTFNPNLHIEYKNNLLSLSAQKADLKNVLLKLSAKTGIYVRFPNSLKKQITTKVTDVSLGEALSKILKGLNHAIIYSGSGKNRAVVSEVFVYMKSQRSRISSRSTSHEKRIAARIRSYEKRLKSLNEKLSQFDKNSRQGKRYLKQIGHYKNIIKNLKREIR